MKTAKIFLFIALLILIASTSVAGNTDKAKEREQVTKQFVGVLQEQWGIDKEKVSGDTLFLKAFGADRLDIIELVMALEEYFEVMIADAEWEKVTTVNSAVELIIDKQNSRW